MNKSKEIELLEVLAYTLYSSGVAEGDASNGWRNSKELRCDMREAASNIVKNLDERGVKVAVQSTPKMRDFITNLQLQPATMVYELANEELGVTNVIASDITYGEKM